MGRLDLKTAPKPASGLKCCFWGTIPTKLSQFHHRAHKSGVSGCLLEMQRNVWENIEESYIVNLYRRMAKLKLKINLNLLQLLCFVVSVALHGEFERFSGFALTFAHS